MYRYGSGGQGEEHETKVKHRLGELEVIDQFYALESALSLRFVDKQKDPLSGCHPACHAAAIQWPFTGSVLAFSSFGVLRTLCFVGPCEPVFGWKLLHHYIQGGRSTCSRAWVADMALGNLVFRRQCSGNSDIGRSVFLWRTGSGRALGSPDRGEW